MATHRIPILGNGTKGSANVFQEPYTVKATNDVWDFLVWVFNDTATRDKLSGKFNVPKNYVGTANLIIVWTAQVTAGDVEIDFDYRAVGGNDTESLDQTGSQQSVNSNDTAPSAVNERMEISIALTDGNFSADDTVEFSLFRDGTDAGDTIAGAVTLIDLLFEYADA